MIACQTRSQSENITVSNTDPPTDPLHFGGAQFAMNQCRYLSDRAAWMVENMMMWKCKSSEQWKIFAGKWNAKNWNVDVTIQWKWSVPTILNCAGEDVVTLAIVQSNLLFNLLFKILNLINTTFKF